MGSPGPLLCLDIGNSHTQLGVFDGDDLVAHWRVSTDDRRTADEWHVLIDGLARSAEVDPIGAVSLCCTVPSVLHDMREMIESHYEDGLASIVGPGVKTGVPILTDNPREVGADRIVNALAASTLYDGASIVVDFGTATTFDAIDTQGRYLGGAIAPGIAISLDALSRRGAQLRRVELVPPRGVIAKNTVEALQSGIVYGFAGQVDGIVGRMIEALGAQPGEITVAATGELAHVVLDECATVTTHEPWLTLTGLRLIHEKNHA